MRQQWKPMLAGAALAVVVGLIVWGYIGLLRHHFAQAQETVERISANRGVLGWDVPTTNEDGTACTDLGHHLFAVASPDVDLAAGGAVLRVVQVDCISDCQSRINDLTAGLEEGRYQFAVKAVDTSGNESLWSTPLVLEVDKTRPNPPGNLRKLK